jgi:hypothetical protein
MWHRLAPAIGKILTAAFELRSKVPWEQWSRMRIDDLLRSSRTCADLYKLEVLSQQSLQTLEWALHDLLDNDPLRSGFESAVAELLSTIVTDRLRSTQRSDPSAF